jgi:hypothetical protein
MDQAKIISYAMQEVLRRWDHENCRLTPGGNYVSKEMVDKYQAEYDELKTMLLKLDGKKGVK